MADVKQQLIEVTTREWWCGLEQARLPRLIKLRRHRRRLELLNLEGEGVAVKTGERGAQLLGGHPLRRRGRSVSRPFEVSSRAVDAADRRAAAPLAVKRATLPHTWPEGCAQRPTRTPPIRSGRPGTHPTPRRGRAPPRRPGRCATLRPQLLPGVGEGEAASDHNQLGVVQVGHVDKGDSPCWQRCALRQPAPPSLCLRPRVALEVHGAAYFARHDLC